MTRLIVSFTTALAFMLHVVLGCCCHHAHAAEGNQCDHATTSVAAQSHTGHSHAGHHHEQAAESSSTSAPLESPCPADECEEGPCVFVAAGKVNLSQLTMVTPLPATIAALLGTSQLSPSALVWDSGGGWVPPLRLHLLNQVLVI